MEDFEKLGVFYLGRELADKSTKTKEELVLYKSKDLTTHAVCVGMTGSGKTGLGIAMLEEAALDSIPAIIIDPKGDLADLLLTFPHLSTEEFLPWVDPAEAKRKDMDLTDYAASVATNWREGLAQWGQGPERIRKLRSSVEIKIYTPGSSMGNPLSILSTLQAPPAEARTNSDEMRDKIESLTSSLLGLLGRDADPIQSRAHILIATIIEDTWNSDKDLDLISLIQKVQNPPFNKIGALGIDTFYPVKERKALAINLNNLLASPGFQVWMKGEPLDIGQLLHNAEGKPKLAILSIAHLSDAERMFFVTLLLNEVVAWMRKQPGTDSLRAMLYMDEIFGFFPPTAMPPSKKPMLTLLKQARAFGLGVVLATQNPVDLDYKGLSNCGTWFIGKLQTDRDKLRILDGLNAASNGNMDRKTVDALLAKTGTRIFIMLNVHDTRPVLFTTRWTMSYLRGPLTLTQIAQFADKKAESSLTQNVAEKKTALTNNDKPIVGASIQEYFARKPNAPPPSKYRPLILGNAKLHFIDSKTKTDEWVDYFQLAFPTDEGKAVDWNSSEEVSDIAQWLEKEPQTGCTFEEIPAGLMQEKNYGGFAKSLTAWLYQTKFIDSFEYPELKLLSQNGESEADFRARVALALREKRDAALQVLREQYAKKIDLLKERLRKAQVKVSEKQKQTWWQRISAWLSVATTILGALLGRGLTKGTLNEAGTSMRRVGRIEKESQGVLSSQEEYAEINRQLTDLQAQLEVKEAQVPSGLDPSTLKIEKNSIKPRKADISVQNVSLVWWPLA